MVLSKIIIVEERVAKFGLIDSYILGIKNYFNFEGRASRSEFWYFILFNALLLFFLLVILGIQGDNFAKNERNIYVLGILGLLFPIFTIIPTLSLSFRRLHDINKSGLFAFIPLLNFIFFCKEGTRGGNDYGPDPYQKVIIETLKEINLLGIKLKGNTIEAIGGTMFAIGATSHEAIELKIINFSELDEINKWLWIIGGILIFIPKCYQFILGDK